MYRPQQDLDLNLVCAIGYEKRFLQRTVVPYSMCTGALPLISAINLDSCTAVHVHVMATMAIRLRHMHATCPHIHVHTWVPVCQYGRNVRIPAAPRRSRSSGARAAVAVWCTGIQ